MRVLCKSEISLVAGGADEPDPLPPPTETERVITEDFDGDGVIDAISYVDSEGNWLRTDGLTSGWDNYADNHTTDGNVAWDPSAVSTPYNSPNTSQFGWSFWGLAGGLTWHGELGVFGGLSIPGLVYNTGTNAEGWNINWDGLTYNVDIPWAERESPEEVAERVNADQYNQPRDYPYGDLEPRVTPRF